VATTHQPQQHITTSRYSSITSIITSSQVMSSYQTETRTGWITPVQKHEQEQDGSHQYKSMSKSKITAVTVAVAVAAHHQQQLASSSSNPPPTAACQQQ
jgi:hypothetical protein